MLCEHWVKNPIVCLRREFFFHQLPFDRSSLTRSRQRIGEDELVALIQRAWPSQPDGSRQAPRLRQWSSTRPCRRRRLPSRRRRADASRTRAPWSPRPSEAHNPAPMVLRSADRLIGASAMPTPASNGPPGPYGASARCSAAWSATSPADRRPTGTAECSAAASRARRVKDQRQRRWRKLFRSCFRGRAFGKGKARDPMVRRQGRRGDAPQPAAGRQLCRPREALPGNPYDGHTLAASSLHREHHGAGLERIVTDAGYKGHNAPSASASRSALAGQKRSPLCHRTPVPQRSAVEPTIGRLEDERRMGATTWPGELAIRPTPCSRP